jgi:hypothetical protein
MHPPLRRTNQARRRSELLDSCERRLAHPVARIGGDLKKRLRGAWIANLPERRGRRLPDGRITVCQLSHERVRRAQIVLVPQRRDRGYARSRVLVQDAEERLDRVRPQPAQDLGCSHAHTPVPIYEPADRGLRDALPARCAARGDKPGDDLARNMSRTGALKHDFDELLCGVLCSQLDQRLAQNLAFGVIRRVALAKHRSGQCRYAAPVTAGTQRPRSRAPNLTRGIAQRADKRATYIDLGRVVQRSQRKSGVATHTRAEIIDPICAVGHAIAEAQCGDQALDVMLTREPGNIRSAWPEHLRPTCVALESSPTV